MSPSPPPIPPTQLPLPTADAKAHSGRVHAHIAGLIAAADGWISFADYMSAALYAPGLGYYAAGSHKFGPGGDFVTAPELSSLFGRCIARQVAQVLEPIEDGVIIELGPGSGRLAADIMSSLAECGNIPSRYCLLEVSPDLRQRQREHLARHVPDLVGRIEWIDRLPERWRGVVIANEVLDAVPPQLVVRSGGEWQERGVEVDAVGEFVWRERPIISRALLAAASNRVPDLEGYVSEVNLAAEALVKSLSMRCDRGALLVVDYGFPAAEYYHPQRRAGTIMVHYRHRALDDPFFLPGLADITAHVDFSAIAQAGASAGMSVAGYTTQAHFLVNCGVLDALAAVGDPQGADYLRAASKVQTLLSPAEMGELFKVLALVRGIDDELLGFGEGDRSHRL